MVSVCVSFCFGLSQVRILIAVELFTRCSFLTSLASLSLVSGVEPFMIECTRSSINYAIYDLYLEEILAESAFGNLDLAFPFVRARLELTNGRSSTTAYHKHSPV